jgi:hypothetical protein
MFVRDFLLVERPFAAVAPRFVDRDLPLELIARHAVSAAGTVQCTRGPLRTRGEAIVVPLQLLDAEHPAGPGSLVGELEVAPFDGRTELGFEGNYRADAAAPGDQHRVTQFAVRRFLQELGRTLEDDTRPSGTNRPSG